MSPKVLTLKNKQAEAADGNQQNHRVSQKTRGRNDTSQRRRGRPGRPPGRVPALPTHAERGPHHPGREACPRGQTGAGRRVSRLGGAGGVTWCQISRPWTPSSSADLGLWNHVRSPGSGPSGSAAVRRVCRGPLGPRPGAPRGRTSCGRSMLVSFGNSLCSQGDDAPSF